MKKYLLLALLILPFISMAQTDNHLKTAEKFIELSGVKNTITAGFDDLIATQSAQMPAEFQDKFKVVMKSFLSKYFTYENLKPRYIEMYVNEFSEKELEDLIAFYNTPTGKKYAEKLGSMAVKGMKIGVKL